MTILMPPDTLVAALPALKDAIAYLEDEITQIQLGAKDHCLRTTALQPLPTAQFGDLLKKWTSCPPVPADLLALCDELERVEAAEELERELERQRQLCQKEVDESRANLQAIRKDILLDVLSKIISVARSKGVDPSSLASGDITLGMIQTRVANGSVWEWDVLAQQVFLFCQFVIADAEKCDQQDAKQKGVELLHFTKTLIDTLRKASMKKEEAVQNQLTQARDKLDALSHKPSSSESTESKEQEQDQTAAPVVDEEEKEASVDVEAPSTETEATAMDETEKADDGEEVDESAMQTRKRRRSTSNPPTVTATEAVEDSALSSTPSTPQQKGPRTRKRRPVLPATRVSSRQMKRRARQAEAAAAAAADDDDAATATDDQDGDGGTPGGADDDGDEEAVSTPQATPDPPARPVLLTKSGRPRKKPGRKPAAHKRNVDKP